MKIKGYQSCYISPDKRFCFIHIEPGDCTKYQFIMMKYWDCISIASIDAARFVGSEWRIKDIADYNNEFPEWDHKNVKMINNPFIMNMADNATANRWTCVAACMAAHYFLNQIGGQDEKCNGYGERARKEKEKSRAH